MDIHQLKSFKTIVEKGNFLDAANELNYSLSAISYQMQQLENEIKFPLFEKIGRRMVPTEQSLKLIPHIKNILDEIEQIRLLNAKNRIIEGSLTISVSDSILTYIIQPILIEFMKKKPMGLQWNVESETEEITLADANMEVRETKATPNKPSKPYVRLTIGGINYAQGLDNLILAYAKATEKTFNEGEEVELPLDAVVKLTPNGAQFRVN